MSVEKPGYKTTEFWVSLVTSIIGILVTLGIITPEQQNTVIEAVRQIVGGIITIAPVVTYAISRAKVKSKG